MKSCLALTAVLLFGLAGCSSDIAPMGRDTFMVSHKGTSWSTVSSLKAECLKDANDYCTSKGLVMVPVSFQGHDGGFGVVGSCELVFRAVRADDPENQRPNMQRSPDAVIQVQSR